MTLEFKQVEFHAACCGDKKVWLRNRTFRQNGHGTREKGRLQHFLFLVSSQHDLTLSARGLSDFFASKPSLVSDWLSREKANI